MQTRAAKEAAISFIPTLAGVAAFAMLFALASLSAAAQSNGSQSKATPPPPNWMEMFNGSYARPQDHPGFKGLHTLIEMDDYIKPLLQPWACRAAATLGSTTWSMPLDCHAPSGWMPTIPAVSKIWWMLSGSSEALKKARRNTWSPCR